MNFLGTTSRHEIPFASLVAFEATARLGSVSRAADKLVLTQSAVSQRRLTLEACVGTGAPAAVAHSQRLTPRTAFANQAFDWLLAQAAPARAS
jgi:LysR family glycine cleavage system transcriptional activator